METMAELHRINNRQIKLQILQNPQDEENRAGKEAALSDDGVKLGRTC